MVDALNNNSGAIIAVATAVYGVATILMVAALLRANNLTRQLLLSQCRPRLKVEYARASPPRLVIANVHTVPAHAVSLLVLDRAYLVGYVGPLSEAETVVQPFDAGSTAEVVVKCQNDLGESFEEQVRIDV